MYFNDDDPEVIERFLTYQYLKKYEDTDVVNPVEAQGLVSRYLVRCLLGFPARCPT